MIKGQFSKNYKYMHQTSALKCEVNVDRTEGRNTALK